MVETRSGEAGSALGRWGRPSAARPRPGRRSPTSVRTGTAPWSTFAVEAAVPDTWDCPKCGLPASVDSDNPPPAPKIEPYKTHLAYVKERRSDKEAADILDEALQLLRSRRKSGDIIF